MSRIRTLSLSILINFYGSGRLANFCGIFDWHLFDHWTDARVGPVKVMEPEIKIWGETEADSRVTSIFLPDVLAEQKIWKHFGDIQAF